MDEGEQRRWSVGGWRVRDECRGMKTDGWRSSGMGRCQLVRASVDPDETWSLFLNLVIKLHKQRPQPRGCRFRGLSHVVDEGKLRW